jgi:t-SNARE complex subunit (syntaxin)
MRTTLPTTTSVTEVVALDEFLTNMQGETKSHVEAFMGQLGEAQSLLEEKEEIISEFHDHEREAADEIASLAQALEEEQSARAALEESVPRLEKSHNLNMSKLTKDHDHALAMIKCFKKRRLNFILGSKFSSLTSLCEELQIQLTIKQSKVPPMKLL